MLQEEQESHQDGKTMESMNQLLKEHIFDACMANAYNKRT